MPIGISNHTRPLSKKNINVYLAIIFILQYKVVLPLKSSHYFIIVKKASAKLTLVRALKFHFK